MKKKKKNQEGRFFFFFLTVSIITPIKQGFTSQLAVFNYFFFLLQRRFESCVSFSTQMLCCLYFLLTQMGFFFFFFCHRLQRDFNLEKREARTHSCPPPDPSQPDRKLSSSSRKTHFNSLWTDTQWCSVGDKDIVPLFCGSVSVKGDVILYSSRPHSLQTKL